MLTRQVSSISARPLQICSRRYTSNVSGAKDGSRSLIYGGVFASVVGGAYYYYSRDEKAQNFNNATHNLNAKAKELSAEEKDGSGQVSSLKSAFTGGDQGFISLKLESVENINHNTKRFRFALPDDDAISGLNAASALLAKYKGPGMEKPVIRPYTPISDEDQRGFIDLVVKRYARGPMSEHFHSMEPNQRLEFKGPIPKYPWLPNKHSHIALIAGGTGITPMYQLIRAIFKNPADKTKVTLVFGNIKEEDIILKKQLEELENTYPQRFRAFYVLNEPPMGSNMTKGMITKDLLKMVLPEPKSENVKIFVCGPPGLYKAISGGKSSPIDQGELDGYLKELGYSKDQVYKF